MTPELWSAAWFSALMSIVLIDLVLAGDNAIVIGLAAHQRARAHAAPGDPAWGTAGAIVVRALLTGVVVWLLKVPGFLLVGGLALLYIGWKLTRDSGTGHEIEAKASFRAAVQTIVVADAVMGVDNVLAVGGAAHGSWLLVIIGLVISIPIVVWGSSLVLKWVERYPVIVWVGAGVLGLTAAMIIATEPLLAGWLAARTPITVLEVLVVGGLVATPAMALAAAPPSRAGRRARRDGRLARRLRRARGSHRLRRPPVRRVGARRRDRRPRALGRVDPRGDAREPARRPRRSGRGQRRKRVA